MQSVKTTVTHGTNGTSNAMPEIDYSQEYSQLPPEMPPAFFPDDGFLTEKPSAVPVDSAGKQLPAPRKNKWTMAELAAAQFPPPVFAVEGLIPEGLSLLIARPKIGKSWLSLQIAVAVAAGGTLLGEKVKRGKALYLALEDSPKRMQDRMLEKQKAQVSENIDIIDRWPALSNRKALDDLLNEIKTGRYTAVIIDTLQRAFGGQSVVKNAPAIALALAELQQFALDNQIAILLVHHSKKSATDIELGGGDVVDDALGGTEIAGVADAIIGIYRSRGDQSATLRVTGRDIEERDLAVNFDKGGSWRWELVGDADQVRTGTIQAEIIDAIKELGGKATLMRIVKFIGKDKSNVNKEIAELVNKYKLIRHAKVGREVFYSLPELPDADSGDNSGDE